MRSTHCGGGGERASALWGTGNRGGEHRSSALWGTGNRGGEHRSRMGKATLVVLALALTMPLAATANPQGLPRCHSKAAAKLTDAGVDV